MSAVDISAAVAELERLAVRRYQITLRERIHALRFLTTDDLEVRDEILELIAVVPAEGPERGSVYVPGQASSDLSAAITETTP